MGMVGRLPPGPAGNQSNVNVPVGFSAERDWAPMLSERLRYPGHHFAAEPVVEEFVKVVENVAVPYTGGENIVFWVGFDK